jgi:hypothetical protein
MGKQHDTFPGEKPEMPVPGETPEINQPSDSKNPDLPQEDPPNIPEEFPAGHYPPEEPLTGPLK